MLFSFLVCTGIPVRSLHLSTSLAYHQRRVCGRQTHNLCVLMRREGVSFLKRQSVKRPLWIDRAWRREKEQQLSLSLYFFRRREDSPRRRLRVPTCRRLWAETTVLLAPRTAPGPGRLPRRLWVEAPYCVRTPTVEKGKKFSSTFTQKQILWDQKLRTGLYKNLWHTRFVLCRRQT